MKKRIILLLLLLIALITLTAQTKEKISYTPIVLESTNTTSKAPCTATHTNDDCTDAISITVGASCVNGATCDATIEASEPAPICDVTQTQTLWYSFVATNENITISTDILGSSCFLTTAVYSGTCYAMDFTQISCADNATILTNFLTNLVIGDTYYVQVAYGSGGACGTEAEFCISANVTQVGESCGTSTPFCTGTTNTFTAEVGSVAPSGPSYGCLLSQPNPSWFYLEVGTAGNIEITLTNSNVVDIDYKIWGPFTDVTTGCNNLTAANNVDCSYSTSATEIGNITGAAVGEVYILLITNYSNSPTDISFTQTAGTGATDCSVLPIDLAFFNVVKSNSDNIISWVALTETNNDYYTIEHSDNLKQWSELNIIKGNGTTNTPTTYTVTDRNVINQVNYYRLKQTDYNGLSVYYDVTSIDNTKQDINITHIYNILGKELDINKSHKGFLIYQYSDNTFKKIHKK